MVVTVILAVYAAATPFFYWKFLCIGADMSGNASPPVLIKPKKKRKTRSDTAEEKALDDYAWNLEHYYGRDSEQREITR